MAFDRFGADISDQVEIIGPQTIDTSVEEDHLITYRIADTEGHSATPLGTTIRVLGPNSVMKTQRILGSTTSPVGYVEHLPTDYDEDLDRNHPLIVYIHGWGATADKVPLKAVSRYGLSLAVRTHGENLWRSESEFLALVHHSSLTMGDFETASIQRPIAHTCEIRAFLDFAIAHYKVDPSRIYLVGFSNGSVSIWEYLRHFSGEDNRVAATINLKAGVNPAKTVI